MRVERPFSGGGTRGNAERSGAYHGGLGNSPIDTRPKGTLLIDRGATRFTRPKGTLFGSESVTSIEGWGGAFFALAGPEHQGDG